MGQELQCKTYTIQNAFPTIRCVKLVEKKEFAAVALDTKHETFGVHVSLLTNSVNVNPSYSL